MPEGPEVRKYADALNSVLKRQAITSLEARTRDAKVWLKENETRLIGRRVLKVVSHGKHLLGYIDGEFYFHSHLMMWGRWQTFSPSPPAEKDRRERARIVTKNGAAVLFSAPIFNVGEGNPYEQIENLETLGPDVLPYKGKFDEPEFRKRLLAREYRDVTIGAALLNQQILAGLGNYLRAEVLFACRMNPWLPIRDLNESQLSCLIKTAPGLAKRAYVSCATVTDKDRARLRSDAALVYQPGREYGTRHWVFRRTNLPCLRCGETVKQLRQPTYNFTDDERTRIIYFSPKCQGSDLSG